MKEFTTQAGGRKTYAEDMINLQNIALVSQHILDEHGDFVVSGCQVTGDDSAGYKISSGHVFINGKIQELGEAAISVFPQYIVSEKSTENVGFADGSKKTGRNVYSAKLTSTKPSEDSHYIEVQKTGPAKTLKESWLGADSVLISPKNERTQKINGKLEASSIGSDGDITSETSLKVGGMELCRDAGKGVLRYSEDDWPPVGAVLDCAGNIITFTAEYLEGQNAEFAKAVKADEIKTDSIKISGQNFSMYKGNTGDETIQVNMTGYNGGVTHSRNFKVGDGKGNEVLQVSGNTKTTSVKGPLNIETDTPTIALKGNVSKDNNQYKAAVKWLDSANQQLAYIGVLSDSDNNLQIRSNNQYVILDSEGVNAGPIVKENGVSLASKYATLAGGLSQLIKTDNDKVAALQLIGGLSQDWGTKIPEKSKNMSDFPDKDACRKNLGIATNVTKNVGWVGIDLLNRLGTRGHEDNILWFKQVGDILFIRATITDACDPHNKSIEIPSVIDIPATYKLCFRASNDKGKTYKFYQSSIGSRALNIYKSCSGLDLAGDSNIYLNFTYTL